MRSDALMKSELSPVLASWTETVASRQDSGDAIAVWHTSKISAQLALRCTAPSAAATGVADEEEEEADGARSSKR